MIDVRYKSKQIYSALLQNDQAYVSVCLMILTIQFLSIAYRLSTPFIEQQIENRYMFSRQQIYFVQRLTEVREAHNIYE